MFGGKAAKEGVEGLTAVKGNRKVTLNDTTRPHHRPDGRESLRPRRQEEDLHRDDLRRAAPPDARGPGDARRRQATNEQPARKDEPQKPTKEYEIDFDVKDTGQKKSIAGYDTHETIVTITVREKGKTLEESGGLVMTNDMWLGPKIPALKELSDFDIKYWKQLAGRRRRAAISAEQMAALMAMFPLVAKATERMAEGRRQACRARRSRPRRRSSR